MCRLVPDDAELAFAVVHACGLSPAEAYSAAVERLAAAGNLSGVESTLGSIQGTTAAAEFDQIVLAAGRSFKAAPASSTGLSLAALLGRAPPDPVETLLSRIRSPHTRVSFNNITNEQVWALILH